tara:strand:- start:1766 stop:2941 length:1176 start_codon:yes stop_codon:yes gene_type:complete
MYRNILIFIFSLILGIGFFVVYSASVQPPRHTVPLEHILYEDSAFIPDQQTGYRYRPNYQKIKHDKAMVDGLEVEIITPVFQDHLGARVSGPDTLLPEKVDIFSIGGSITWGQGVRQEETFSAVFAQLMGNTERNFAISGVGGVSSYFQMKKNINLNPKWILYGFFEDHLNRNLRYCVNSGLLPCTPTPNVVLDSEKSPHFSLAENAEEQFEILRNYLRTMHMDNGVTLGWRDLIWSFKRMLLSIDIFFHPEAYNGATEQQKMEAAIFVHGEMARVAKEHGAGLIIVYIPSYSTEINPRPGVTSEINYASARLVEAVKKSGSIFVDTSAALIGLRDSGESIFIKGDGHLSVEAHKVIAKVIFEKLMESSEKNQFAPPIAAPVEKIIRENLP